MKEKEKVLGDSWEDWGIDRIEIRKELNKKIWKIGFVIIEEIKEIEKRMGKEVGKRNDEGKKIR